MKTYNRSYLKQHYDSGIYVSIDGKYAERDYRDKSTGTTKVHVYKIFREECGRAFIHDTRQGRLYLDFLVLTCYRGKAPQDGKTYYPFHKDGDMKNSNLSNLEWREETQAAIEAYQKLEKESWYKNRKITANKKGQIKQGSKGLPLVDYMYDSDLDWTRHYHNPWVDYEEKDSWGKTQRKHKNADEIFEDLGFVNGDKSRFSNPVILHRNNDYLDYTTGNLEWCDSSDPRYEDFEKIRHDDVMKRDHDCNCRLDERSWRTVYGDKEPYQDWADRPEKKLYRFY